MNKNNLESIKQQNLESVDLISSSDECISMSHNDVECKTSIERLRATASVDEVEVRSSVDEFEVRSSVAEVEVKHMASADSSADDSLRIDDLDESLGLSKLFSEPKRITWCYVIDLDKESLQKLQKNCDNLKPLFRIAHTKKQIVNCKSYFYIDDNILMHCCKHKDPEADLDVIQIIVPKCLRKELLSVS